MTAPVAASLPAIAVDALWALWALAGVLAALAAGYLVLLAFAALGHRRPTPTAPRSRVAVLVPAHNEAQLIARCVDSLQRQSYPADLYDIVVVADNCTDDTALRAEAAGAIVLVRHDPDSPGKGPALHWSMDRLLCEHPDLGALVVVDADSVVEPGMLGALVSRLQAGADVVQAEYLGLNEDGSAKSELRCAAFLLFHRVRFGGRAFLGLPCNLVGNGMLFSRRLLEERPWDAFTSAEDLEYSVDLRLAGVQPVFAAEARLRAPVAGRGRAARVQRLRWEGGRFHVVRTRLPKLIDAVIGQRRWSLVDAAVDLAVPPLGLLATASLLGAALGGMLLRAGVAPA
jgi:1,2-diacylglycerol 3-beta-glucosyltransferase